LEVHHARTLLGTAIPRRSEVLAAASEPAAAILRKSLRVDGDMASPLMNRVSSLRI
jgi:hypothetical protein